MTTEGPLRDVEITAMFQKYSCPLTTFLEFGSSDPTFHGIYTPASPHPPVLASPAIQPSLLWFSSSSDLHSPTTPQRVVLNLGWSQTNTFFTRVTGVVNSVTLPQSLCEPQ